jgi:hypothetical protein
MRADVGDDPRLLLAGTRALARRVRREQRVTWFPLLVFAALTFASVPVQRYGGHHLDCGVVAGASYCRVYSDAEYVYWPVALVLAYVAIAAVYLGRSRARGVGTRVWPYAVAGVVVAMALTAVAVWELTHPPVGPGVAGWGSPAAAVGLALLVLARAERNWALAGLTVAYLIAVFALAAGGVQPDRVWYGLPQVCEGAVLLAGGVGFAVAQRPGRGVAR